MLAMMVGINVVTIMDVIIDVDIGIVVMANIGIGVTTSDDVGGNGGNLLVAMIGIGVQVDNQCDDDRHWPYW